MNNISNLSDNIIKFPIFNKITDLSNQDQPDNSEFEYLEGTIEYHQNRGLDLFKPNESLADTKILTDNPSEIFKVNSRVLMLSGYSNIWHLLSSPTNSKELIESRKNILDTINNLPIKLIEKIYTSRNNIIKLNSFGNKFDHFDDLKYIIDDLKEIEEKGNYKLKNDDSAFDSLIFAFDEFPSGSIDGIRKMIPGHIQLIRNIPGDFFTKTADELFELFKTASKFSLKDLKNIYEKKDHEAFSKLRYDVEKFCKAYSHWDSVVIVAEWAQSLYVKDLNNTVSSEEVANNIRDPRFLLRNELDDFFMQFPNDLPSGNQIEVYNGGNGSGKSTWLKTRLMLQLFYQTYGKVPANDAKLMMRDQIVFVNRGGSGYGEDLSAFGNDIERKLMSFLPNLQKDALIFLDEFGSTISEKEAYYLIRALNDYLKQYGAKVYMATHNELYINWANTNSDKDIILYNFQSKMTKDGEMNFLYKLTKGKDNAHTLNVFRAAGMPNDILKEAKTGMLGSLNKSKKRLILPYKDIVSYTQEEREKLKLENKGFAGFTRYNEMVKHYYDGDRVNYEIVRKYKPLGYDNRPNPYYSDEDLFFLAHHPSHLGQNAPELSFDFMRYGKVDSFSKQKDSIFISNHLKSKNIQRKNIYTSSSGTLASLTTWGLTSDTKELQERQKFFEEIGEWSYEDANMLYRDINTFEWIIANFQKNGGLFGKSLDFDYNELSRFNKAYWLHFFGNIEEYTMAEGFGRICEWFIILINMEEKLGNLPAEYKESHKDFLDKLKDTIILIKRFNRANERKYRKWQKEFKSSAELSEKVCERISETLDGIWDKDIQSIINTMKTIYQDIDKISKPIDILSIETNKRSEIISFLNDSRVFRNIDPDSSEYSANGFRGMIQVISALKGTGNLLKPLLDKLRSFNSVHAHQIANYIEDFIDIPDVEDFLELVKLKRDDPIEFKNKNNYLRFNREHGGSILFELNGLVDMANQIKKLGWTKVNYNNTGEIDIKGMIHPGLEKSKNEQVSNDLFMSTNQSFDILEGATMGGKTVHLQSMQWIIRLAHSIGYVPAQSATLPCFDGLVYIDRILEDEEKKLSAGQNDAKSWSEIILKMRKIVKEKSEKGRYWFAIDEMISSVPARFQKGLVTALLEELTSLGQKGQISIHNPKLVSILLENNPNSYKVRHPEVVFNEEGKIIYTYKINPGRSVDKEGHFTAYSIETAEKMGLPKEIIDRAREYKNGKD